MGVEHALRAQLFIRMKPTLDSNMKRNRKAQCLLYSYIKYSNNYMEVRDEE